MERKLRVKDVMARDVITVKRDVSVGNVIKIMKERDVNALPVVDEEKNLVGIITQRDLMFKTEWFDAFFYSTYDTRGFVNMITRTLSNVAGNIMHQDLVTVGEEETICRAAQLMVEKRKRQLPVVHNKKLVGIVSRKDVTALIIEEC